LPTSASKPYAGIFPIAPTPFTEGGDLDIEGQCRVLDCMIDQGVDGICILANYSEQFLLSDAERSTLLDVCTAHVAGRVPVIATTSHFATRIAVERARAAAKAGAAMLMVMPPYHGATLRAEEKGIVEHFSAIAEAAGIPIMVQDAPLSGVNLSVALLARLAREVPLVRYFKIEVAGAAAKLRSLIEAGGQTIADSLGILLQMLVFEHFQHRQARCAGNGISAKGTEEFHPVSESRRNLFGGDHGREGKTIPDRLA